MYHVCLAISSTCLPSVRDLILVENTARSYSLTMGVFAPGIACMVYRRPILSAEVSLI